MLLDFQMPLKTGMEVVHEVRAFIRDKNSKRITVEEPVFAFASSYVANTEFQQVWRGLGVSHFFEKPLRQRDFKEIERLVLQN